jgi:hypothetical protein
MTPPPASAAAHARTRSRRAPASRIPRRVSGPSPARPRAVANTHAGAVALPRTIGAPPPFRRWLRRLATLPDHRILDRLLNGSAWIGIVGFALIGIVFMQVSLLKLNAGIGHAVERAATLDRQNSELRAAVSELGSNDRIQAEAQRLGLVVPPAGSVTFLGKDGKRVGGDAPIALATNTAASDTPAGTGAGATAAAAATVTAAPPATSPAQAQQPAAPATAQQQPTQSQQTAPASPQPAPTTPSAGGTAAGGATPVTPVTAQQP